MGHCDIGSTVVRNDPVVSLHQMDELVTIGIDVFGPIRNAVSNYIDKIQQVEVRKSAAVRWCTGASRRDTETDAPDSLLDDFAGVQCGHVQEAVSQLPELLRRDAKAR